MVGFKLYSFWFSKVWISVFLAESRAGHKIDQNQIVSVIAEIVTVIHHSMITCISDENSDENDNYRILVRIEENHNIWWEFRRVVRIGRDGAVELKTSHWSPSDRRPTAKPRTSWKVVNEPFLGPISKTDTGNYIQETNCRLDKNYASA